MAVQFTMTLDGRSGNKSAVVKTTVILIPGAGQITLMTGDNIDTNRRVEIMNAVRWLYRGIVERDLFTAFAGSNLVTSCPLDDLSIPVRKTQSDTTIVLADDVAIAISLTLMDDSKGHGSIETAHRQLADAANEDSDW